MTTIANGDLINVTGGEDCNPLMARAMRHVNRARQSTGYATPLGAVYMFFAGQDADSYGRCVLRNQMQPEPSSGPG